jgi:peptide/nickel transport system ATP-binding protein
VNQNDEVLLAGRGLSKVFGFGRKRIAAVKNVDFDFHKREIITIVGESGSGKTTLAKVILGLLSPSGGVVEYQGRPLQLASLRQRRAYWRNVQGVFQDPFSSFNLFRNVGQVLSDCIGLKGLDASGEERERLMREACKFVNLKYEEVFDKFPFELSGGQMQRLMIARIFLIHPSILIADEPTSMIDACSRSMILEMLMALREKNGMMIVFITHDMGLAYYVSDTIYIMQAGEIRECGPAEKIIQAPAHEYTRRLLSDVPKLHEPWLV